MTGKITKSNWELGGLIYDKGVIQNPEITKFRVELEEGDVWGVPYHVAVPVHCWDDRTDNYFPKILKWCRRSFGSTCENGRFLPGRRWYVGFDKFWFKHERDLAWFLLRWQPQS
jgi:hypothetical protein